MNMIKDLKQNWHKSSLHNGYNSYYGDSLVCDELTEIIAPIWLVRVIRRWNTRRREISGGEDRWPYSFFRVGFWYLGGTKQWRKRFKDHHWMIKSSSRQLKILRTEMSAKWKSRGRPAVKASPENREKKWSFFGPNKSVKSAQTKARFR